ncbi:MAG: GNAT family N-acetyltransferase [Lachnospiraceae bacterium]|nr:GNAT family N-acetyltransferase [Lachnospiraceae bacterium]
MIKRIIRKKDYNSGLIIVKKLFSEIPFLHSDRLTIRKIGEEDADGLYALSHDPAVYRYLPTFLYEQKYEDIRDVMKGLYDECLRESIICGIYLESEFSGLIELYGLRSSIHKISVGYRPRECLGKRDRNRGFVSHDPLSLYRNGCGDNNGKHDG